MLRPRGQGQFAFLHGCRGELQCGQDIGPVQVREVNQELGDGQPRGELAQDRAHRHPGVPDAGQAAHLVRVDGNPLVRHARSVRRPIPSRRAHRISPPIAIRQTINGRYVDWRPSVHEAANAVSRLISGRNVAKAFGRMTGWTDLIE